MEHQALPLFLTCMSASCSYSPAGKLSCASGPLSSSAALSYARAACTEVGKLPRCSCLPLPPLLPLTGVPLVLLLLSQMWACGSGDGGGAGSAGVVGLWSCVQAAAWTLVLCTVSVLCLVASKTVAKCRSTTAETRALHVETAPGQLLTSHRLVRLYWLTPMNGLHLLLGPERPFCLEAVPLLLGLDTAEADGVAILAAAGG